MTATYPDPAKSERKDALVPDPQEYDMSDPDRAGNVNYAETSPLTAKDRLDLFSLLVKAEAPKR